MRLTVTRLQELSMAVSQQPPSVLLTLGGKALIRDNVSGGDNPTTYREGEETSSRREQEKIW